MSRTDEVWAACGGTILEDCDLAATSVVVLQVEDVSAAVLACERHATAWTASQLVGGGACSAYELFTAAQVFGHPELDGE